MQRTEGYNPHRSTIGAATASAVGPAIEPAAGRGRPARVNLRQQHQDPAAVNHPHILLCAYQCGPGLGSVSQIGWEWYTRLAQRTQVTLVTHIRNKQALSEAGAPLPNSTVQYIDTEWFAGPLYRLAKRLFPGSEHSANLISSLDFYVYDAVALRRLRRVAAPRWQVVHVVTPVSPVAATRLYKLGPPSIVGPWNGGLETPSNFPELMRQDAGWVYGIRVLGRAINRIFGTTHNVTRILAATAATERSLPQGCRFKVRHLIENGVDLQLFQPNQARALSRPGSCLRVLFVGRLIPVKGIPLLLEAVQRVQAELPIHVTIAGGGSLLASLQAKARSLGVEGSVAFVGPRSIEEISGYLQEVDLFCLPSIRESGGAVLLEAMAAAVPVVGVRWGGPGELIDDEIGALLSADGPQSLIHDLVAVLRDASQRPEVWRAKGLAGRRRAERLYDWDAKIEAALGMYRELSSAEGTHARA